MPQIICKDLTLGYDGRQVLSNLHFEVNAGDYLCIVGENGAGKSTLMKTMLGLMKPMSGTISFGDGVAQNEIGYLPQHTDFQKDFPATVWEIVLSGCQGRLGLRPFYSKPEKDLARKHLEMMGMESFSRRSYRHLSGGQQQRVLLARALCATQKILLLDEPVAGLDPMATAGMYDLIRKLNREEKVTILMISHDMNSALKDATHVLYVGPEPFFGTVDTFRDSPAGRKLEGRV